MRPEHTQRFIDTLGQVRTSGLPRLLAGSSLAADGPTAAAARAERRRWNGIATSTATRPRLIPVSTFRNRPRLAA